MSKPAQTLTQLEDITMALDRKVVETIVNTAIQGNVSAIVERAIRRVTDELDGLASNIEDVVSSAVSDAERAGEVDSDDLDHLEEAIVDEVMEELSRRKLTEPEPTPPPQPPTIAELYHTGQMGIADALYEALDTKHLAPAEVTALLKMLSTDYEADFALFLWRHKNGSAA